MNSISKFAAVLVIAFATNSQAQIISQWNFETNVPPTITNNGTGPSVTADVGNGTANGLHASAGSDWGTATGNGSSNSFSVNGWAANDYFQFSLSTVGSSNIFITFSQTGSGTGPRDFSLQYSLTGAGGAFIPFASYAVLENTSGNGGVWSTTLYRPNYQFTFDLSSITGLNNNPNIAFRLVNTSAVSTNGGAVGTAGTSRVDDFYVSANAPGAPPVKRTRHVRMATDLPAALK